MGFLDSIFSDKKTTDTNSSQSGSQSYGLTPEVMDYWKSIAGQYNPAAWSPVDPNQYQTDAAARQAGYASGLAPSFGQAQTIGSQGISTADINRFMSPYQDQVVDATVRDMDDAHAKDTAKINANAAKLGALSGTQPLVARSLSDDNHADARARTIATLRNQGFGQAANLAGQSTQAQLAGVNAATGVAGQQAGINNTGFGQGSTLWGQSYQNTLQPYQIAQMGAQTLGGLAGASGNKTTGTSSGTSTQTAMPSLFSIGSNIAGLGLSAWSDERLKENIVPVGETYDGQQIYKYNFKGSPKTEIGLIAQEVEEHVPDAVGSVSGLKTVNYDRATEESERGKADGGSVMPAYRGATPPPHEKLATAFHAITGMIQKARGGSVMAPFADGGAAIGPWETTVTPAKSFDFKKLGDGLSKIGQSQPGGSQDGTADALRDQQSRLSSMMSGLQAPARTGFEQGGVVPWGESGPVFEGREPVLRPFNDPEEGGGLGAFVPSASRGAIERSEPDAAPSKPSGLISILPGLNEGVWAGKEFTPMQRLGTALMSVTSPTMAGPTNGIAANLMAQNQARMEQRRIEDAAAHHAAQLAQSRGIALGKLDGQDTLESRRLGQSAAHHAATLAETRRMHDADIAHKQAISGQLKLQDPEYRAKIADEYGLMPGTMAYQAFVLNGVLSTKPDAADNAAVRRQNVVDAGLDPNADSSKIFIATGKMPREDQQPLTVTDKKAILESDEAVSKTQGVIDNLNQAIDLSKKAYTGPTAGVRGYATSLFGSEGGEATENLNNLLTSTALQDLKATFGGNPTEGERKILMEIQGSANKAPAVREGIYRRAIALANRRQEFNKQRAAALRNKSYYSAPSSGAPSASVPVATDVPPVPDAQKAADGNWYVPDPARPGKFLKVTP